MKTLKIICSILFVSFTANIHCQTTSETKARNVVEKSIKAMGGIDLLKNIKTLFCNSETKMEGNDVNWITKEMLPNKGSFEIVFQGRTVYKGWFDGQVGYELVNGEKKKGDQNEHKDKKYKKNIFNEIDYLDTSLYRLEYVGEDIVNGKDCDKIKTILSNGKVKFVYFDKETSFPLKEETVRNANESSFSTVLYKDYKKFGELMYASEMSFETASGMQTAKVVDLYYNKDITESDFN